MKKDLKYILVALFVVIAIIAIHRYEQYVLSRNFLLEVNSSCSPGEGNCFVADCSPQDDPSCDLTPYKKIEILARNAPKCLEEHNCEAFSCKGATSGNCQITYCSDDTREEWERCVK